MQRVHGAVGAIAAVVLLCASSLGGRARAQGDPDPHQPILTKSAGEIDFAVPVLAGGRVEGVQSFTLDRDGSTSETGVGADLHFRLGLTARTGRFAPWSLLAEYEQDIVTGAFGGESEIPGQDMPYARGVAHPVRKAYLRASLGPLLHLAGGLMTSHWGLGLVANDGAHGWAPGNARFGDPRGGDRVLRLMAATGPLTDLELVAAVAFDWAQEDDALAEGDEAKQLIGAVTLGAYSPHAVGFYGVYRRQRALDGDKVDVGVFDIYARSRLPLGERLALKLAFEGVLIRGSTTLAGSANAPEKDVVQLGAALRATLDGGRYGLVLDLTYASGDGNLNDAGQNAFKADPNYELSLLLYRHVLASHTGRAVRTASDPELLGVPPDDIDRFATKGSMTNTIAVFPRVYLRPLAALELYGGPLFAFTEVDLTDPFNTNLSGGSARNALDGAPGSYLGTEVDLGVRYRPVIFGTELTLGLEGGVLLPGSAFKNAAGERMGSIYGGRVLLQYRM